MDLPYLDQLCATKLRAPIWVYDIHSNRIVWSNSAGVSLWEAESLDALKARDFSSDQSQAVEQMLQGYIERFKAGEYIDLWWEISPAGIRKRVFSRLSGVQIETEDGVRVAMLVEAMHSPELFSAGDIPCAAMAVLFDEDGTLLSSNPPFCQQFGDQIQNLNEILCEEESVPVLQGLGSLGRDIELNTQRGRRWHHAEVTIKKAIGDRPCYAITLIDIQQRKQQEITIANEARSDCLTGLMNRRGLLQYMDNLGAAPCTLFYIDLDGFKPVNDNYGHAAGDKLLCQLAHVLMTQPGHKICARVGGDEFVTVFLEALSPQQIDRHAQRLLAELSAPQQIMPGCEVRVSGSLGIASMPEDAEDIHSLLINADAAMYEAKKQGRNRAVIYQPGMESWLRRRAQILHHLDEAIATNQLNLHFQPILNGISGEVILVEALLRWHHPTLGPLSPLEFIQVAEESGKITALENWVIGQVCLLLPVIRQLYTTDVRVSVNISGANMAHPDFADTLLEQLAPYPCSPADIVLELTESVLVPALEKKSGCLNKLVAAGFQLAIDDFGTGYSSLAYINQLPASYVKIDRAFINRLDQDPHTLLFIRDLCEKFGMRCIAEGVELESQNVALNRANISLQQGFYFARPASLTALMETAGHKLLSTSE